MKINNLSVTMGLVMLLFACTPSQEQKQVGEKTQPVLENSGSEVFQLASQYFKPLPKETKSPASNLSTPAKKKLGKLLYFDSRLSKSKTISCNFCHNLSDYGIDRQVKSIGHEGQIGERNAPTVFNSGFQIAQFWDGRAKSLEEQAGGPILNPGEMAMPDEESVVKRIEEIQGYHVLFNEAFPSESSPISFENITKAIASFERSLMTPSRFDQFLQGQEDALNEKEKKGLRQFIAQGCIACHSGVALGGERFEKFGLSQAVENLNDEGRFKVTGKAFDREVFKVPILRNIAETAPYFHDGSVKELKEAVKIMGQSQLGKELSEEEIDLLVTFLKTLTGEISEEMKKQPKLPS